MKPTRVQQKVEADLPPSPKLKKQVLSKELSSPLDSGYGCSDIALSHFDSDLQSEEISDKPCTFSPSAVSSKSKNLVDSGLGLGSSSTFDDATIFTPTKSEKKEELTLPESFDWTQFYETDDDFDTCLHILTAQGNQRAVFEILRLTADPAYLDLYNIDYQTALHVACWAQQPAIIRRLVACGVTIDFQDKNGNTPLHLACKQSNLEILLALTTPIIASEIKAAQCSYSVVIDTFSNDILDIKNNDGEACIHLAVKNNERKIVEMLYQLGADINSKEGKCGRTPLHYAVLYGNLDMVYTLVKTCRARVNEPDYSGHTAIEELPSGEKSGIKQYLLKHGAYPAETDSSSNESSDSEGEDFS